MITKARNIFRCIVITLALLVLLVTLLVPWILNIWVLPSIGQQLGVQYSAENIWLNPLTGTVSIEKGVIRQQQSPLIKWHEIHADIDMLQLLKSRIVIEEVALVEPSVWLKRDKKNKWNFESLIQTENKTTENGDKTPVDYVLQEVLVKDANIYYSAFKHNNAVNYQLKELNFLLEGLSSDFTKSFNTKLDFYTKNEGLFAWKGEVTLTPLLVKGETQIKQINIPTILNLLPQSLPLKLKQGKLDEFQTAIHLTKQQEKLSLTLEKMMVGLSQLNLSVGKKEEGKAGFSRFTLDNGTLKWPSNQLDLGKWKLDNLTWQGKLNQQRQLDWVAAFQHVDKGDKNKPNNTKKKKETSVANPWKVGWQQGVVTASRLHLNDLSIMPVVEHQLHLTKLTLNSWHNQQKQPMKVSASGRLAKDSKFNLALDIGLKPLQLKGGVDIDGLHVSPYQGYWQPFFAANLAGKLSTKLQVAWKPDNKKMPYQLAGNFRWNDWLLKNLNTKEVIGEGKQLAFEGISLLPNKINISALSLDNPNLSLQRELKQRWNFSSLLPEQDKSGSAEKTDENAWAWYIDSLVVKQGILDFRDMTVDPIAEFNLNQITGNIKQLSSEEKKSNLKLSALIADSDLKVEGELIPLNPRKLASVKFAVNNMSLPMFSSYAAKYLGYPVERGKLGATLYYNVKDFTLQSDNKVTLNKLRLGKKTKSKEAVDAPVKLALALLEDRKGKISLDVPVKGDFTKPDVKYGQLVVDAVMKLFASIAASPFNLLTDLVSFSGKDVDSIKFRPGSDELTESEQQKLLAIYKVLEKRPSLILEVQGQYDSAQDKQAIAKSILLNKLELEVGKEKQLSSEERKQWLKAQLNKAGIITDESMSTELLNRLLIDNITVSDNKLITLAKRRAKAITNYIARQGKVNQKRIYRLKVKSVTNKLKDEVVSVLTLNAP